MPTDLDQVLAETLQDRANRGAPIDPARLMQAAVIDGGRIRTRRRVVTTVLAAVAVGAVVVTATLAPRPSHPATRFCTPRLFRTARGCTSCRMCCAPQSTSCRIRAASIRWRS